MDFDIPPSRSPTKDVIAKKVLLFLLSRSVYPVVAKKCEKERN